MSLKLDTVWRTHQVVNEWTRFADTKATAVLGINSLLSGFAVANVSSLKAVMLASKYVLTCGIAGCLCLIVSVYFCLRCLSPTLRVHQPPSRFYYADIATRFPTGDAYYHQAIANLSDEAAWEKELATQIWAASVVALRKYRAVAKAIWCLSAAIVLGLSGLLLNLTR